MAQLVAGMLTSILPERALYPVSIDRDTICIRACYHGAAACYLCFKAEFAEILRAMNSDMPTFPPTPAVGTSILLSVLLERAAIWFMPIEVIHLV